MNESKLPNSRIAAQLRARCENKVYKQHNPIVLPCCLFCEAADALQQRDTPQGECCENGNFGDGHRCMKQNGTEQPKDSVPEPMQCSGCGTVLRREDAHIWSIKAYCNDACAAKPDFIESHIKQSKDAVPDATSAIPILAKAALQPNAKAADFKRLVEWVTHPDTEDDAEVTVIVQGCELQIVGEVYDYDEDRTDLECLTTIKLTNQDDVARLEAARAIMERRPLPLFETQQALRLPHEVNALIDEALTFSHQDCGHRDQDGYGCIRCAAENADMRRRSNDNFQAFAQANGRTRDRDDAADLLSMADRMSYLCAKFEIPNSHEFEGMARGIRDLVEAWRTDR